MSPVPEPRTANSENPAPADDPLGVDAYSGAPLRPALSGAARMALVLACLVAAAALVGAGLLWRTVGQLQQQLAQNATVLSTQTRDMTLQAKSASEASLQASAKVALLEARLATLDAQHARTDATLQTLAAAGVDGQLAELRAALQLGQQQAQLTGSAQPLVGALTQADKQLAALRQPRLLALQQAIGQDLARLKTAPLLDVPRLAGDIDAVLQRIDTLPLQSGRAPSLQAPPADKPVQVAIPQSRWLRLWQRVQESTLQLVRVRTIASTDTALLAPEQAAFVREHLRLRLLNARLAVLSRQPLVAQQDLAAAQALLSTYFDDQAPPVKSSQFTLDAVGKQVKEGQLPSIAATLAALSTVGAAAVPAHAASSAGG